MERLELPGGSHDRLSEIIRSIARVPKHGDPSGIQL